MTTRASLNGTSAAEMESEAAQYSNPYSNPEMEEEWEMHEGSPYSSPEMEEEWETHEGSHYSNPYSSPETEEEWEAHETHEGSHYSNPYSNPEWEEEWEAHEGSHYSNPYSNPEFEEEWEMHEGSHYSNPYSNPEMEWEMHEGSHYSNPYSNPEFEEEWETHEGSHYSNPEMEWEMHEGSHYSNPEWETHEGSHYSNPYSNPEWEDESDRFFPLVAKAATKLLPHAVRIGRNLIRGGRRRPAPRRSTGRSQPMGPRNQQISGLFHQLGRIFAQGESEAAVHEAHLFGANEFETEVAANEIAHEAALTEVMAAEASHTESAGEAEALLGAALPISMKVMGGRIGIRRLTPTLLRVNAQLVLNLHRQGAPGRQLLRVMPSVQRRTVSTLGAIERSGQPVTPTVAANVMRGQAARVLTTPHICRQALTRNMIVRQQTVAPGGPPARPGITVPGRRYYRPGMVRPGTRPGVKVPGRPSGQVMRPGMRAPLGMRRPMGRRAPGGPARMRQPRAVRPHPVTPGRPVARPQHAVPGRSVPRPRPRARV